MEIPQKFKSIVDSIDALSVLDLHELVKVFEEKYGVSAAAMAVAGAGAGAAAAEDTGGLVTITLDDAGAQKIQVIKVVKDILGLGLGEAKALVDGAPKVLKEGISKDDAAKIKKDLEAAGAKVSVK